MASKAATDFLTKEVKVSNNIVTFRLLSRQLELELYYEEAKRNKNPIFATYILTGAATPQPHGGSSEQISRHLVLLANEGEIDAAKSKFTDTPSQHVYSLSPVALKDHGLLTSVADRVRQLDKQHGQAHAARVGMLLSEQAPWPQPGSGKSNPSNPVPKKGTPAAIAKKSEPAIKPKALDNNTPPPTTKDAVRQSALDFGSKKLVPGSKVKETLPEKPKEKKVPTTKSTVPDKVADEEQASRKTTSQTERMKEVVEPPSTVSNKGSTVDSAKPITASSRKIGSRSKRILDSDEEPAQNHPRPSIKRKKSRIAAEDNDDAEPSNEHNTASLQAMMDIDDDTIVNGRSNREATPEHVPSAREVAAAAKAAKIESSKGVDQKERKSHRRAPKGKKRVMKTRRVKNAKGYMVTEDYSSYEDADPNDTEKGEDTDVKSETDYGDDIDVDVSGQVVLSKPSKPTTLTSQPKRQQSNSLPSAKPKKGKSSDASKPGQQKLASFFGKK
ncbi:unnamed protein product [Rhizoctonia solani]|uniref:DNA polymerase delta subunit 3 n=1 Tax=Rhizoctonia solani TaxID=456999 RepID=A0A8H3AJ88_9AGAM|nr:unnamed protein product [Rhizoctonia solani]